MEILDYKILREVGRGSQNIIYLVEKDGKQFALKTLIPGQFGSNLDNIIRLRREAAAMARVSHPGIVKIFAAGEASGIPYIVMELLEGKSLLKVLQELPLTNARLLTFAKAITGALGEIHRLRMVHRDIKPENMIVNSVDEIKLIDLGLVGEIVPSMSDQSDVEVVGTLLYSAPEQNRILKRPVDGRSDLYSLGITLYEAAIGKPPFIVKDISELLKMHATVRPTDVHSLRPEISPVLAKIISKLLEKDPDDRYQSSKGLLADLEQVEKLEFKFESGDYQLGQFDRSTGISEVPLIGRTNELALLKNCAAQMQAGSGSIVLIKGEAGSGKSRLALEVVLEMGKKGIPILRGKCDTFGQGALAPLREAVNVFFNRIVLLPEKERTATLLRIRESVGNSISAFGRLSPTLKNIFVLPEKSLKQAASENLEIFYQNLVNCLRCIGEINSGLVLFLDDIQWLDEGSFEFLKRLRNDLSGIKVLIVATARNHSENEVAVENFIEQLKVISENVISLNPMTDREISQMIAASLGGRELSEKIVAKITVASNRNPFAVSEYLNTLLSSGILSFKGADWDIDEKRLSEVTVSKDVYQLILNRISDLDDHVKEILSTAAISGVKFNLEILRRATNETEEKISRVMQIALSKNLAEPIDSQNYSFVHDRIREALISRLNEVAMRDTNDLLALCLEESELNSPEQIHMLAHYYLRGNVENNKVKACRACLGAGRLALANCANRSALELLSAAYRFSNSIGDAITVKEKKEIYELFGVACLNTGDFDRAHEAFDQGLFNSKLFLDKANFQYWKMRTYSSQGELSKSWEYFQIGMATLERKYPHSTLWNVVSLAWFALLTFVQSKFGMGFASLAKIGKEVERKRVEMMCLMFETSYLTAYFRGSTLDLCQITFRQLYYSTLLGVGKELVYSQTAVGTLFGTFKLRKIAERNLIHSLQMAKELNDVGLETYVRMYQAISSLFYGDMAGFKSQATEVMPFVQRYLPVWLQVQVFSSFLGNLTQQDHSKEAIDFGFRNLRLMDDSKNYGFMSIVRALMFGSLELSGRTGEAHELMGAAVEFKKKSPENVYSHASIFQLNIFSMLEREDLFNESLEIQINEFLKLGIQDYFFRIVPVYIVQLRLQQYEACKDPQEKKKYKKLFKKAIFQLSFQAMTDVHRCHYYIAKAALARMDQKFSTAYRFLEIAEKMSIGGDSFSGLFWLARERARVERARGNQFRCLAEAKIAMQLSIANGWKLRLIQLENEFGLRPDERQNSSQVTSVSTTTVSGKKSDSGLSSGWSVGLTSQRAIEALLEVSLTASNFMDPKIQASAMLDTMMKLMGAERGCIFLGVPEMNLDFFVGRTSAGEDLEDIKGYSTTVVKKVFGEKKALVVTGTDQGETLGSQSIVAHNLKSIMAVPLLLKDVIKGVVYLDSSLVKGIFTEDDLIMLSAISNQVAVAVETAKLARLESERRELAHEMELTSAVQKMFLPRKTSINTEKIYLSGIYRPAVSCGGDWWWYQEQENGRISVFVGDVTGHGANAAMITASVASSFKSFEQIQGNCDFSNMLHATNKVLFEFAQGEYYMPSLAADIDVENSIMKCWSASAPEIYLVRKGKKAERHGGAAASPLGFSSEISMSEFSVGLSPGDRVFITTDGMTEMLLPDGDRLGERKFMKIIDSMQNVSNDQVLSKILESLDEKRATVPQDDDFTLVMFEVA